MKTTEEKRAYARRYYAANREKMRRYFRQYQRGKINSREYHSGGDGITRCRLCGVSRRSEDWAEVRGVGHCLDCARRVAR